MDRRLIAALALPLALALTGCGGDDEDAPSAAPSSSASSEAPASPGSPEAGDDEAAIDATMREFLVSGDCDLATTEYLRSIALFADESTSREEACTSWQNVFSKPLFGKDDVVLSDLQIDGEVATVKVGSHLTNITTLYQLTRTDGTWLVSGDEFNTDGL